MRTKGGGIVVHVTLAVRMVQQNSCKRILSCIQIEQ